MRSLFLSIRAGRLLAAIVLAALAPPAAALSAAELEELARQVTAEEAAFARTMAERRIDRFAEFVAADAVFRGSTLRRGRAEVVAGWRPLFEGAQAPFSWAPDAVTVADDGRSALSTGPVRDARGRRISRFTSLWRKEADGHWRVAVDQGVDEAGCTAPSK